MWLYFQCLVIISPFLTANAAAFILYANNKDVHALHIRKFAFTFMMVVSTANKISALLTRLVHERPILITCPVLRAHSVSTVLIQTGF